MPRRNDAKRITCATMPRAHGVTSGGRTGRIATKAHAGHRPAAIIAAGFEEPSTLATSDEVCHRDDRPCSRAPNPSAGTGDGRDRPVPPQHRPALAGRTESRQRRPVPADPHRSLHRLAPADHGALVERAPPLRRRPGTDLHVPPRAVLVGIRARRDRTGPPRSIDRGLGRDGDRCTAAVADAQHQHREGHRPRRDVVVQLRPVLRAAKPTACRHRASTAAGMGVGTRGGPARLCRAGAGQRRVRGRPIAAVRGLATTTATRAVGPRGGGRRARRAARPGRPR